MTEWVNSEKPIPNQVPDLAQLPAGLAPLIELPRWVNWDYQWDPAAQKWDKPPVGSYKHMLPYGTVLRRLRDHTGIGFVLTPDDNIAAIDFDDIWRGDDDAEWARPFLDKAAALGAYIETTVSGKGARIIGRTLRTAKCSHEVKGLDGPKSGFEIYRRRSKYITISGDGEGSIDVVIDEIIDDLCLAYPEKLKAGIGQRIDELVQTRREKAKPNGHAPAPSTIAAAVIGQKDPAPPETQEEINKLWSVLNHVGPDGKRLFDPDCSYREWLDVLMAIASTLWSCALQIAEAWSKQSKSKYVDGEVAEKFRSFTRGRNGITERSLYHKALAAGWQAPQLLLPAPAPMQAPAQGSDPLADLWWHGTGGAAQTVPWLIKNVLPQTGVALIPGQWGTGKTFVALDLANSTARGMAFANYRCKRPGGVLYIAAEGASFIPLRLRALDEKFKADKRPLPLAVLPYCPPFAQQQPPAFSLFDFCKAAGAKMLELHKVPLVLIIIDTLSAAYPFKDAHDAAEAQKVMNYLADMSRQTDALVAAVDHYGKDGDAGTRGSSAKEASADAIMAVLGERSQAGVVSRSRIAIRKARGGSQGAETYFTLPVMQLGVDEDNEPIMACTVEWAHGTPKAAPVDSSTWPKAARQLRLVMTDLLRDPSRVWWDFDTAGGIKAAKYEDVRAEFYKACPDDGGKDPAGARRKKFNRAVDDAIAQGLLATKEAREVRFMWFAKERQAVEAGQTILGHARGTFEAGQDRPGHPGGTNGTGS